MGYLIKFYALRKKSEVIKFNIPKFETVIKNKQTETMKQRSGSWKYHQSNKNVLRLAKIKKKERNKLPMSGLKQEIFIADPPDSKRIIRCYK